MDLGFSKKLGTTRSEYVSVYPAPDIALLLATTATQQAASPTAKSLAAALHGGARRRDSLILLARVLTQGDVQHIDTSMLGGSFNPSVARKLMVGKS